MTYTLSEADDEKWITLIENSSQTRPTQDAFTIVVDGLLDAISDGSFEDLDQLFGRIDVIKINTDYLVALLSITFENREQLNEWRRLHERVVPELERRGVDVALELAGLDDVAGASLVTL
jgi:DNA phosphorothioation-dependent restriction protein DptG